MRYRKLDENGDMVMNNGNAYYKDADAARQAVVTRLRLLIYEWWEDVTDGVPYWQQIIGSRNIEAVKDIIRQRIQNTKHILSILDFAADWDNENRKMTIRAVVESDFGTIVVEGEY